MAIISLKICNFAPMNVRMKEITLTSSTKDPKSQ